MPVAGTFALFQLFVLGPFALGAIARRQWGPQPGLSRRLVRFNLIFLEPGVVFWSTWGLRLQADQVALPVAGFVIVGVGFLFGILISPLLRLEGIRRDSFWISASLGNHGFTLCGFICYLLLGDEGLGLAALFTFYFTPYLFLVIFPFARSSGHGQSGATGGLRALASWDYLPLYAAILALALSFAGIERPDRDLPLTLVLLPMIGLYYLTLGLSFETRGFQVTPGEMAAYSAIKFILVPAFTALAISAGETWFDLRLSESVELVLRIMSFAPAATFSVMTAILYDLDRDFSAGLFVGSVLLFLFVVLPALYFLL